MMRAVPGIQKIECTFFQPDKPYKALGIKNEESVLVPPHLNEADASNDAARNACYELFLHAKSNLKKPEDLFQPNLCWDDAQTSSCLHTLILTVMLIYMLE